MHVLRTPDSRFHDLPGWPWAPRYVDVAAATGARLRMAFVDEGPRDASVVLLLHGDPTWSYLWRKVLPPLLDAGMRVVAPDLVGFGRSDKPGDPADHDLAWHVHWLRSLLARLDLRRITLVGHGTGGMLGLRALAASPTRFERIVLTNTGLPTGDVPPSEAFRRWQAFTARAPEIRVGEVIRAGCAVPLPDDVVAAYDAPFVDAAYQAALRALPSLVPTAPTDAAAEENRRVLTVLRAAKLPMLLAFSEDDPFTAGQDGVLRELPGVRRVVLEDAGHYTPEDRGEELAALVASFAAQPPSVA